MPETPWTSKPVLITGALASAVIIALTAALITTTRDKPTTQTQPAPTSPGATTTTPTTPTGETSICGLTDTNNTIPTTGPIAQWSLLGTIAVPSIEGQGPGKIEPDGFRSCYAHTPTGALLAAANMAVMNSLNEMRPKFRQKYLAPGIGRNIALKEPVKDIPEADFTAEIGGFRITKYTGKTAEVKIGVATSMGVFVSSGFTLVWANADWKIQVPENGSGYAPSDIIAGLDGYTQWSGVK